MTTTVTSSIGTASRDYSTIQAWEDASPADLTSVDQIWRGECYNDATFSNAGSTVLTVSGTTTDSTRYKELTCAAGQSFSDNASVQTNALSCDQANGVLLTASGSFQPVIQVNEANFHISGLQIAQTGSAFGASGLNGGTGMGGIRADKLLVEVMGGSTSFTKGVALYSGVLSNTQITIRGGTTTGLTMNSGGTQTVVNVTVVRVSDPGISGSAIEVGASETITLKNVACFGCTNEVSSTTGVTATTCYTDKASPMTGFTTITYDTSTGSGFQTRTDTGRDFRLQSTSAMIDTGTTDSLGAVDIAGTSRPSGSAYDVGAWEYVSAGGGSFKATSKVIGQAIGGMY